MIEGKYEIFDNGKKIAEHKNLITTAGKKLIYNYLAGNVASFGEAIGVGTFNTAPSLNDSSLYFEFARGQTILKAADYVNSVFTVKATLPTGIQGYIYEYGLFPSLINSSANIYGTRLLTTFDSATEFWNGGTYESTFARVGVDDLQLSTPANSSTTVTNTTVGWDLSGYSNIDQFAFAYTTNDANTTRINITMYTDLSNYFIYSFVPLASQYTVANFVKGNFTTVGTPNWANINICSVTATAGGTASVVELDGLQIIDKDVYQNYSLVSRAIVPANSPQLKVANRQLDIQYSFGLTL